MSRLKPARREDLSPEGQAVWDGLTGERGHVRGPYPYLVHNPALARAVQDVSSTLRFRGTLEASIRELAIVATGYECGAPHIVSAHSISARKNGTSEAALSAVQGGATDKLGERERLTIELARSLVQKRRVDDALYAAAARAFGEQDLLQLVTAIGYYTLNAMVTGTFSEEG